MVTSEPDGDTSRVYLLEEEVIPERGVVVVVRLQLPGHVGVVHDLRQTVRHRLLLYTQTHAFNLLS